MVEEMGYRLRFELWMTKSSGVLGTTIPSMLCVLVYITYGQRTTMLLKIIIGILCGNYRDWPLAKQQFASKALFSARHQLQLQCIECVISVGERTLCCLVCGTVYSFRLREICLCPRVRQPRSVQDRDAPHSYVGFSMASTLTISKLL